MPSSTDALRQKFMTIDCPDGITTCESLIRAAGGEITNDFLIIPPAQINHDVGDAIVFLCDEWDYGFYDLNRHE